MTLDRLKDLAERGAVSEKDLRDAERQVQTGEIAVRKAELTLRSWGLSDQDIGNVEAEADRLREHKGETRQHDEEWARVKIEAPIDGTIVEWNVTKGDVVTDTTADLFKIADLSVLSFWLHTYEEYLPYLERMPKPIPVTVELPSNPEIGAIPAAIENIGDMIDQNEHMAMLIGHVENPRGDLRVGQFVTGKVALAPKTASSRCRRGPSSRTVRKASCSCRRSPASIAFSRAECRWRRNFDVDYIRSHLSDEQKAAGLQELHEGERVAASETVQLKAALRQKQLTSASSPQGPSTAEQP